MGLDVSAVRFLVRSLADGASFEHTLTIGRQGLFVEPEALDAVLGKLGRPGTPSGAQMLAEADGFADPLFRALGASTVSALDLSTYQGASIAHDMNQPVDASLKNRFSVVFDGGSLEHIFNFPQAVKNCMEMVSANGHFLCVTVANNFLGHGFYQFSPELFFRVLSPVNGFRVTRMIAFEENWSDLRYYEVADPEKVGRRVTLANQYPTYLMIAAQRTAVVPVVASPPQQSDYVTIWNACGPSERPAAPTIQRRVPSALARVLWKLRSAVSATVPEHLKLKYRRYKHGPVAFDPGFFREIQL